MPEEPGVTDLLISISLQGIELEAELQECTTSFAAYNSLPCKSAVNRWGDELYFDFPIAAVPENLKQDMDIGDLGYWLEGQAVAIFFGPTPVSTGEQPRAAVPVIHIGRLLGDATVLRQVRDGTGITLAAV